MKANLNEFLEQFAAYMTSHDYQTRPMLTAYVDIDTTNPANMRERPAWIIDLKNQRSQLAEELGPDEFKRRSDQVRWEKGEEMILSYLQQRKPTGRSIALFTDLEEDFIAFDLPVPMETRLYYGMPQIKHLLFALDQYKTYLVALFAASEVRLAEVNLTRVSNEVSVDTEHERLRRLGRKAIEHGQDRRGPEFEGRYVRDVAASLNDYFLHEADVERMLFGGNTRLAQSIYNALHPAVQEIVVAVTPMDIKVPAGEIADRVKGLAAVYELEHDTREVADLISAHHRGGAVALGHEEVQEALAHNRVKSLLLPYPIDATQFDSLILSAAMQGISIEFVFASAADELVAAGGIGAHLYYTVG